MRSSTAYLVAIAAAAPPAVSGFISGAGSRHAAKCTCSVSTCVASEKRRIPYPRHDALSSLSSSKDDSAVAVWDKVASSLSGTVAAAKGSSPSASTVQLVTLVRVGIPSIFAGIIATLVFPAISLGLAATFNDAGVFAVLSQDSSQFVQNFLTVSR